MRLALTRAVIAALLSVLAGLGAGQVRLTFDTESPRRAWIGPPGPDGIAANAVPSTGRELLLSEGAAPEGSRVWILDESLMIVAERPLLEARKGWAVKPSDFTRVAEVRVQVLAGGQPVQGAVVTLFDGKETQTAILGPKDGGETTFFGVRAGSVAVRAKARAEGQTVETPRVTVEVRLDEARNLPPIIVSFGQPVDQPKVAVAQGVEGAVVPDSRSPPPPTWMIVIGLAALGGLAYGVLKLVPKHKEAVNAKLSALGVQIPDDAPPDAHEPDPPVPARAQPVSVIDLGADAKPSAGASPGGTPLGPPRLVRLDSGASASLAAGATQLSREAGLLSGEASVSRRHAEISWDGHTLWIEDQGSTNGTFVNSVRITERTPLRGGDTVQFGQVNCRIEGGGG